MSEPRTKRREDPEPANAKSRLSGGDGFSQRGLDAAPEPELSGSRTTVPRTAADAAAPDAEGSNLALAVKAAAFRDMGLDVSVCGSNHGL